MKILSFIGIFYESLGFLKFLMKILSFIRIFLDNLGFLKVLRLSKHGYTTRMLFFYKHFCFMMKKMMIRTLLTCPFYCYVVLSWCKLVLRLIAKCLIVFASTFTFLLAIYFYISSYTKKQLDIIIQAQLVPANFERVLSVMWAVSAKSLADIIHKSIEKKKPAQFFVSLYETFKLLLNFFYGDKVPCEVEGQVWISSISVSASKVFCSAFCGLL